MGIAIAAGVAASGALSYAGSQNAASAASGSANDQANAASLARNQMLAYGNSAGQKAMDLAAATPQELNALGQSYQVASSQLEQQQRLMASIDPSLMAASKQALQIMQGGNAAVNNPMMALRNSQRAQLVNSLQAQYGPGAESTSIGQRQLQQFDMQSDSMFQQNQMSSLNQLMGISNNGAPNANLQSALGGLQQVGQGYSALQNRQLNAQTNVMGQTLGAMSGTNAQMIQTAGAPYVGQALQGQANASLGNSLMNTGSSLASAYAMRPSRPTTYGTNSNLTGANADGSIGITGFSN